VRDSYKVFLFYGRSSKQYVQQALLVNCVQEKEEGECKSRAPARENCDLNI